MSDPRGACVVCGHTSDDLPLVTFEFRGAAHRICTQHLPVLIHQPHRLAEVLPGSQNLRPADHTD